MHNRSAQIPGRALDTTYSSGENACVVPSTRRASSSSWLASGNYSDTEICCKARHCMTPTKKQETYFKMTTYEWVEVAELQSTQEEEDTRLLLHALYAARTGLKAVIVTAMLLCFAFQKDIPCPIYQMCVTQNRTRFVDIGKLAWQLGDIICGSLIRLHAVTP